MFMAVLITKKKQVVFINSFSTEDCGSFNIIYNIIQFLSKTKTENGWPECRK